MRFQIVAGITVGEASMAEQSTRQIEDVRGSGIYPATGPLPPGRAIVRTPAALGHPEERGPTERVGPGFETAGLLAGRAILGGYFLYHGINHLYRGINHYVRRHMLVEYARSRGVPAPGFAIAASGLLMVAGGVSILTGALPKLGAGLISTFLLGVSPRMHASWKERALE